MPKGDCKMKEFKNASVTLPYDDFKSLVESVDEFKKLKNTIGDAVKSIPTYEEEDVNAIKFVIDTKKLNDVIYKYHSSNNAKDEWINDAFPKDKITFEYNENVK